MFNFLFNFQRGIVRGSVVGAPEISITSGGGYAGSTYTSTVAGQWTADGAPISGATGPTYTMTAVNEGKAIRCGESNTIEMWIPTDIAPENRAGGTFTIADGQTVSGGRVASWTDRWGTADLVNAVAATQPAEGSVNGMPCAMWPDATNSMKLTGTAPTYNVYSLIVGRYSSGVETTFADYNYMMTQTGINSGRISGQGGTNKLFGAPDQVFRYNGIEIGSTDPILPMPVSTISLESTPPVLVGTWGIGDLRDAGRGWRGPIFARISLEGGPSLEVKQLLEGWAAGKYGVTLHASHPYKTTAPRIS